MIIDINTAIGHWPFRRLSSNTALELRDKLVENNIGGAAVTNTNGLFYKNCHDANLELAEQIKPYSGYFFGVATLNPTYAACEPDLDACVHSLGFKALRLVPRYHNYTLQEQNALALVAKAASMKIPIIIPQRIVDIRQCHWMDTQETVNIKEVQELCSAVPDAKIIYTEATITPASMAESPNLYVEMSRMNSAYGQGIAELVARCGSERVLFGTGAPFKEISPAILKLNCAEIALEDKERVSHLNAKRLLKI